ncbi:MAG: hypothetical protein WBP45_10440 [Daejeonella sp.]
MRHSTENVDWTGSQKIAFRLAAVFVLLFIGSFSFPISYIPDIGKYSSGYFEIAVKWFASYVLKIDHPYTSKLISDSTGLYIHTLLLMIVSAIICGLWSVLDRRRKRYDVFQYWFMVMVRYYLALQLFYYGFNKVFKVQFYLPEPNTLFTTVGNIYPDLMFWTSMGISRPYVVFTGVLEVIAAILLLFRRTRLLGGLLATGVMANVVAINFCFDISVKLYSCFLLLMSIISIAPDAKRIMQFFVLNGSVTVNKNLGAPEYKSKKQYSLYVIGKIVLIVYMVGAVLSDYVIANNFNDDQVPRPLFHGAYEVNVFVKNQDTIPPLLTDQYRWRRFFIHRRGYAIIQSMNDEMQDYELGYDIVNNQLLIKNYEDGKVQKLNYTQPNDSVLFLIGKIEKDSLKIELKKIPFEKLPLLQPGFHWTIDN